MRLVILFIQILFELKRQREVTPFVRWFYATEPPGERQQPHHHDVHAIPYQVFFLMINLEVSLQNYQVAKDLVRQYFATPKPSAKGKEKSVELSVQQQSALVELFIVNILLPMKQYSEARAFVFSMQSTLAPSAIIALKKEIDRAEDEMKRRNVEAARVKRAPLEAIVVAEDGDDDAGGRRPRAANYNYYATLFGGILTLFWFVYWKQDRLRGLRDAVVRNLRELLESAFSYDRTSLNQPRPRRRLGN
ncbi:Peroxin 26 (Pex26), putative [Acanthamoeba castellanii str. Neff]|uniref:Uncharacterized protein n=1 Tax=Acanthamoeba castellanii (strain ATCC 30010 / Neff) TaxID=1257118 RepID=L8H7H6_ACACF|nr:Peroxin 26 (Pex26), putative [Acanthamoeba castellanii str. Neff]ELR20668.1 hypothetical protein ACA1_054130 [Acanthamoeba castellanii str. Neff]